MEYDYTYPDEKPTHVTITFTATAEEAELLNNWLKQWRNVCGPITTKLLEAFKPFR